MNQEKPGFFEKPEQNQKEELSPERMQELRELRKKQYSGTDFTEQERERLISLQELEGRGESQLSPEQMQELRELRKKQYSGTDFTEQERERLISLQELEGK